MATSNNDSTAVGKPSCPAWCTLPPGHDPEDPERLHDGPSFGRYYWVACSRADGTLAPGELGERYRSPELETVADIRQAASELLAAAEWLEAQQ